MPEHLLWNYKNEPFVWCIFFIVSNTNLFDKISESLIFIILYFNIFSLCLSGELSIYTLQSKTENHILS